MADLTFYSSVRRGAALGITRKDDGTTPAGGDHARLQVTLTYDPTHAATATLPLVGPGDIVGLDTRCIVRTFPRADDNDAEDAFLCYVDFDQVDLPWRYTPSHYTQQDLGNRLDRVRPWLTLLVFVEGTEVSDDKIRAPRGKQKLPQLTVSNGTLLPDLANAWAWAHVQGEQAQTDAQLAATLTGRPGALVARLLSPRILDKSTAYRAFLVPTFMRGVLAAQGEDPGTMDALKPAWTHRPPATPCSRSITRGASRPARSVRSARPPGSSAPRPSCRPPSASARWTSPRPVSCRRRPRAYR